MITKVDMIIIKKLKAIIDWYEDETDGEYTVSIESAEKLRVKLEEIK